MYHPLLSSFFALSLVFSLIGFAFAGENLSPDDGHAQSISTGHGTIPSPASSTVYSTTLITVTQCPSSIPNCPAESKTVAVITTSSAVAPYTTMAFATKPSTTSVLTVTSTSYYTKVVPASSTPSPWYPSSSSNSTTPYPTGTGSPPAKSNLPAFTGAGHTLNAGTGLRLIGAGALAAVLLF